MPCARAGDFEVHVAVVIFGAGDVGEDGVLVAFLHQTHRDAADRRGDRHARVHQRQRGAADRGHRARAVRFENVADHAQRVRESFLRRESRADSARSASAPWPISRRPGAAHEPDFADAERREVVVQHETLGGASPGSSSSIRCSSSLVPSVTVTSACVSPRVNSAEPCVRGSRPASMVMSRISSNARPSGRRRFVQHLVAEDAAL